MLRSPEVAKKPFAVRNEADVTTVMDKLHTLAPVIETSCVTGEGMNLLQKMLFSLPKRRRHENKVKRSFEFLVEDIFNVPGVGAVVSGFVNAGELTVGSNCHVYVGPTDDGSFLKTVAKSAHIARINTSHITSGQSACLALALSKEMRKKLRRGMVVLKDGDHDNPTSTRQFDAEICVLKGEGTTIRRSYQAYVHILNVRQSAFARNIEIVNNHPAGILPTTRKLMGRNNHHGDDEDSIVLRPGSRAKVRFEVCFLSCGGQVIVCRFPFSSCSRFLLFSLPDDRSTFDQECACCFVMDGSVVLVSLRPFQQRRLSIDEYGVLGI